MRQAREQVRFGVGVKLGAVVFSLASVAVLLLMLLFAEKNIAIAFAQKEVIGNKFLRPLRQLSEATYRYQSQPDDPTRSQEVLAALQRLDTYFSRHQKTLEITKERSLFQGFTQQLGQHDHAGAALTMELSKATEQLNRRVGDTSNLILDPDLDSYYLMDLTLLRLPEEQVQLSAILGELRESRGGALQREKLRVQLGLLKENLASQRHSLETACKNNPVGNLNAAILQRFDEKARLEEAFLAALTRQLDAPAWTQLSSLTALGEQSLSCSFRFGKGVSQHLEELLEYRIDGFERRKWGALILVALVLVTAMGFSILLTRHIGRTLRRVSLRLESLRAGDITRLERGIVALAEGRHDIVLEATKKHRRPLEVKSKDELGRLARSVNQLSGQAQVTIEALVTTRDTLARTAESLRQSEQRMRHQAFHDSLTGLPNRAYIMEQLYQSLERARQSQSSVALLFLDLDNFKVINDSQGHEAGDCLLQQIAQQLRTQVRPGDVIARLGGDEFLVLIENLDGEQEAIALAEQLCKALEQPLILLGKEIFCSFSLGVAFSHHGEIAAFDLIKHADIAMYRAKKRGKGRYVTFHPEMNALAFSRMELEAELRQALLRPDELCLQFQPIYRLQDKMLCEVEALVRWNHPRLGLILPDRFIPIAEETGLIVPLGWWILRTACQYARAWDLPVSVNLSLRQLQQEGFPEQLRAILAETGALPERIKLEVTETLLVENPTRTIALLGRLKELGVRLALDDFGVGYSSMTYLRDMPIDTLKIDRSFVRRLGESEEDEAIVQAMVQLAKALHLTIVCEGIETRSQEACLERMDCDYGQGYLYAHPQRPEELMRLLKTSGPQQKAA